MFLFCSVYNLLNKAYLIAEVCWWSAVLSNALFHVLEFLAVRVWHSSGILWWTAEEVEKYTPGLLCVLGTTNMLFLSVTPLLIPCGRLDSLLIPHVGTEASFSQSARREAKITVVSGLFIIAFVCQQYV